MKYPSPCYILEEEKLQHNLEILNRVQKESGAWVLCALKGYAMWSSFPLVRQYLHSATASSLNEAKLCFEEMKSKAHLCAPIYTDNEIDDLLEISSHITFNSLNQWERFKEKTLSKGVSPALRINPQYSEVETDLYNPCVAGSRLGIIREQIGDKLPEGIEGLHSHTLCENDSYVLERTLEAVEERFGDLLHQVKWLNLGGGHHITREDYDVEHLISLLKKLRDKYNLQIILEPGEAVGWKTGFLTATIEDIIDSQGINVAMLDVSFSAHMPDCLEMPYKPEVRGALEPTNELPTYRLGGGTCLAGDFLGDYSFQQPLEVGQQIIFEDMIHYTMVKTTFFNGVKHPSISVIRNNGDFEIVREFEYEDYKNKLS
ncbi:MAG: carboxynorspermidine decarboxylase [Cytophagales bacterium]|nr:carboxynorspermidine decarboxylase [Cytophagales bacterium]